VYPPILHFRFLAGSLLRAPAGTHVNFREKQTVRVLYVNGKFLSQPITGVQRYAAAIVQAWDEGLDEGWIDRTQYSIRVVIPQTILREPRYRRVELVPSRTKGRFWEQVELPWRSRGSLLFSPYAVAPLSKARHSVTIHDAGAAASPQQYSLPFRAYCYVVFRLLGRICRPVFTVSEFSKRELKHYYSVPLQRMVVIPPACDHLLHEPSDSSILKRAGLERDRYILGVSSQSPIKNFEGLTRAWESIGILNMKLAIAGKKHDRLFRSGGSGLDDRVVQLGYVSDAELRCLYENAAVFAYPSFYEGFGIPPVEAMFCGCPVVVARSSSLAEACGDAAIYCDPSNPQDIARCISEVLGNTSLAEDLREKGRKQACLFTERKIGERVWQELSPYI
jgi:glycosyltransferase involved in cell wall biosynthesis